MKNKLRKITCLIVLTLFPGRKLTSQVNLVTNGGFEANSSCPNFGAQWDLCTGWDNVNLNTGVGNWGTPDYFHTCGSGPVLPPNTFAGTCSPHTGGAMMALVVYNIPYPDYREYLSSQLSTALQVGKTYRVSFWLTNGLTVISPWTISNFGVCFSSGPLSQSGYGIISATPQCEVTANIASTSWVQYTFSFVAPSPNIDRITLGAFRTDGMNNVTQSFPNLGGAPSSYSNYFIDDVEVFEIDPVEVGVGSTLLSPLGGLMVFPNPTECDEVSISGVVVGSKVEVLDASGRVLISRVAETESVRFDLTEFESGIYFVKNVAGSRVRVSKLILSK